MRNGPSGNIRRTSAENVIMIFDTTGEIADNLYMLGHPATPIYLFDCAHPVLFDAGLPFMGRRYVKSIQAILGKRHPSFLFLSHSHFDHCGSVTILKSAFPQMKVFASSLAGEVLQRPNALRTIEDLCKTAMSQAKKMGLNGTKFINFKPFALDGTLQDGDTITLSDNHSIQVFETPGHTRDSVSFYIPEERILMAGEALGIPDHTGYIIPECLSSYDEYKSSSIKLRRLNPHILCVGHYKAFTGKDATRYIEDSISQSDNFRNMVDNYLSEEKGDLNRTMERFRNIEYDGRREDAQPEVAYYMNLKARINAVLSRKTN